MAHANRWFTSGLFGTQTDGSGGPFRAPSPVCTPLLGFRRASVVFSTTLTLMALVWVNGPVSAETVVNVSSSALTTVPAHEYVTEYTKGASADDLTGYTLADHRLANAHFSPSLVPWALMTAACESGFDDTKVGSAGEVGRHQVHPLWIENDWTPEVQAIHTLIRSMGYEPTRENLALPEVNAAVTNWIVSFAGMEMWTTQNGCSFWND